MPHVARYESTCPGCDVERDASYDPRNHDWAQTCGAPASGEDGCGALLTWEPVYARPPKKGKARDQQRACVYRAETAVVAAKSGHNRSLDPDWRSHVGRILASVDLDPESVEIRGSGGRHARASFFGLSLPRWARTVAVACHEVAHVAASRREYRDPGHGEKWCALYLALVRAHLGAEAHAALHASFTRSRVRVDWDLARTEVAAIRARTEAR